MTSPEQSYQCSRKKFHLSPFFAIKQKAIIGTAKMVEKRFGGKVPKTESELVELPGVGYKTAHVILGELHGVWEGIATDTHVKRFAKRFDLTDQADLTKISKDLEALIHKKRLEVCKQWLCALRSLRLSRPPTRLRRAPPHPHLLHPPPFVGLERNNYVP